MLSFNHSEKEKEKKKENLPGKCDGSIDVPIRKLVSYVFTNILLKIDITVEL